MAFPLTLAVFVERCPDFAETATANPAFVEEMLLEAARSIDATVWGEKAEDGHRLLTAHLITIDPRGRDPRVETQGRTSTTYGERYQDMRRSVGTAYRLVLE